MDQRPHCSGGVPLKCHHAVTYYVGMTDDDRIFKALADPTRRFLLGRPCPVRPEDPAGDQRDAHHAWVAAVRAS